MTPIRITRERLNAFRLVRQKLEPRGARLEDVLDAVGWLPTREAGLLSVAVRLPGFCGADLARVVFDEKKLLEMAALRDQSFLVPRRLAAAALRCPSPRRKEAAEKALAAAGLDTPQRIALRSAVIDLLDEGPLGHAELAERLQDSGGVAERVAGREGALPAVLSLLQLEGQVVRTNLSGDLLRGKLVYALAAGLVGGQGTAALEPAEAARLLAEHYFDTHGPATLADFAWWAGLGTDEAGEAFRKVRGRLTEVEAEGVPYPLFVSALYADELATYQAATTPVLNLVPFRDPWLSSHEARVGRFVTREDVLRILPGPALPAVLVNGVVAGRWSLRPRTGEVKVEWFRAPGPFVDGFAAEIGKEIGAFAAAEMPDLAPLTIPTREGPFDVYE